MPTALDFMTIWKEGLDNQDSSKLSDIITEDWTFSHLMRGPLRDKPATLDWTARGNQVLSDIEILYENAAVAVGTHGNTNGIVMFLLRKRGNKFSSIRHIRERTEN